MNTNKTAGLHVLAAGMLLMAAFVLRAAKLDQFELLYDERITLGVVGNIFRGNLSNNWKTAEVPPVYRTDLYNFSSYFYADAAFVKIASTFYEGPRDRPVLWHRVGSALAGTLALLLFYWLALKWFDRNTALIFLGFLTVTPLLVQDAHYARPEAFELVLVALLYLLANRLLQEPLRYSVLIAAGLCVGFLGAMKFSLLPMIAPVLFCVPGSLWRNPRIAGKCLATAAGAVILGMFAGVPDAFFHPGAYWNGIQFLRSQYSGVHRPHGTLTGGNTGGMILLYFWQTLGPLLPILALAGTAALLWSGRRLICLLLWFPIGFYFVGFSTQHTFFERNFSHVVPLFLLLSAAGLSSIAEYVRRRAVPRWLPSTVAAVLFVVAAAPPALLSKTLVFEAMPTDDGMRAGKYQEELQRKVGKPIAMLSTLLSDQDRKSLIALAEQDDSGVLVRVVDYGDPFTAGNLAQLGKETRLQEVGVVPGLFTKLSTSTLQTYHSASLRYFVLRSKSGRHVTEVGGQKFRSFEEADEELNPGRIELTTWAVNGFYTEVVPPGKGSYFGSWTQQRKDGNTGVLRMGPVAVDEGLTVEIPVVTGPAAQGLSLRILDHTSGAELTAMSPPPVLQKWQLWQPDLPKDRKLSVDIVAGDQGSGWGQWMAMGVPRALNRTPAQLGAVLPFGAATVSQGGWTLNGYYPDAGPLLGGGVVYGSWSGSDANTGVLRLGPISAGQQTAIGIPLVTGPNTGGLSVKVVNTRTGKVIASLEPPPVRTKWWVWSVNLPQAAEPSFELIAVDGGSGFGQWLAIGQPHARLKTPRTASHE